MHPVLLNLGSITIYTYGFFVGMGFLSAVMFAGRRAEKYGIVKDQMADLFFVVLVSSILGARALYVIVSWDEFSSNLTDIFKIWNGGLVFYGGFLAALVAAYLFIKKRRLPLGKSADIIAPAIALGHAVGRIGCFFAGCCYGRQCDLPWAVTFTDPQSLAPLDVHLHPTQLYESLANFMLFGLLLVIDRKKSRDGMTFWSYIAIYGLLRAFIEIFRGDPRGDFMATTLSVSQGIGLGMVLVGGIMLFYLARIRKNG